MSWLQIRLDANPDSASALEDALLDCGAASVTLEDNADQPLFEPPIGHTPIWQHTRVTGMFQADTDMVTVLAQLNALVGELPKHRIEILEDRDWIREWMDSYQPLQCGKQLWICPSWREPVDPMAVNLLLDPGLAFGTGTHPTTWLCLNWLDSQPLTGKTVIDYGCGSGILGIAALLLGAEKLIAVDTDPQALQATSENAKRNNIDSDKLACYLPEEVPPGLHGDVLLANILAGPLMELAPTLAACLDPGAPICLSGILDSQGDTIKQCYQRWFVGLASEQREEWLRISGQRNSESAK